MARRSPGPRVCEGQMDALDYLASMLPVAHPDTDEQEDE